MAEADIDLNKYPIPPGVPKDMWDEIPEIRRDLVPEIPHPQRVVTTFCSGNTRLGIPSNHVCRLSLETWKWNKKTRYGWGQWQQSEKPITSWRPRDDFGPTFEVEGRPMPIINRKTHGRCPDCNIEFV